MNKKLRIIHSNDIHADLGGNESNIGQNLFNLNTTIEKYKNDHSLYMIAGDILTGSLLDSETKGVATIQGVNYLNPDVVCVGNHEFDYGATWLLLLEKIANFPILSANVYIKNTLKRLFEPYKILEVNGIKILIVSVVTLEVVTKLNLTNDIDFLNITDPINEVKNVLKAFKGEDIDFTICLTHLGLENDVELAKSLDQDLGVDLIIGGHSHSFIEEPIFENNIMIVQAGDGSNKIGVLDLEIDINKNTFINYSWNMISTEDVDNPIIDKSIKELYQNYNSKIVEKFSKVITVLPKEITHINKQVDSDISKFLLEIFLKNCDIDVCMINAGFTRVERLDKIITLGDVYEAWPFNNKVYKILVNGITLDKMIKFNVSNNSRFYHNSIRINLEKNYSVSLTEYYFKTLEKYLGIKHNDLIDSEIIINDVQIFLVETLDSHSL